MRFNDFVSGFLILLFGLAVAGYSRTFPPMPGQSVGPSFFPALIGGGLVLCGVRLLWSGRRRPRGAPLEIDPWVRDRRTRLNFALVIAALVFYALAVETLGFFITAFVFLGALFLAFGVRRRWIAPLAGAVTLLLHAGFYSLLRVPLPWGWLEPIAW